MGDPPPRQSGARIPIPQAKSTPSLPHDALDVPKF